jgi:lipoprotein-releasing system permease protein
MQIRAVSESGGGHLRIVNESWPDLRENSLRVAAWDRCLEEVHEMPGVKLVVRRARANGLLAFGNRTAGVVLVGVEPQAERRSNRVVYKSRVDGRYLNADDTGAVVIGSVLAKRLDVELDDDLFVTLVARDEIQSAMLRIVGTMETGSREIDSALCHVTLSDVERLTGYEGPGEISIMLDDYRAIDQSRKWLAARLPTGNAVITWREINPAIAGNVEGDRAFTRTLVGIIVLVVSLGIMSAQLTAVLERRTEFAILSALGMKGRQVAALMTIEAFFIALGGTVFSLMLGGSAAYYLATEGVNFGAVMGEDLSFGDILLDPYMYADFGVWLVWYALGISIAATMAATLYPVWFATRMNPATALRVE